MFTSPSTKPGHGVCVILSLSLDKLTGEYVILKMSWFIPITPLHRWPLPDFLSFFQGNFAQVVNIRHYNSFQSSIHLSFKRHFLCFLRFPLFLCNLRWTVRRCSNLLSLIYMSILLMFFFFVRQNSWDGNLFLWSVCTYFSSQRGMNKPRYLRS